MTLIAEIKDMLAIFFILFGAGFIVAALLSEGSTVGKFTKPFCWLFGFVVMALGSYIYY